jgi:hypothetical protein
MTRYEVHGTRTIRYELTVEADSPGEAKQIGYRAITFRSSRDVHGRHPHSILDFWEDPGTLDLDVNFGLVLRSPTFPGGLAADTGPESNI